MIRDKITSNTRLTFRVQASGLFTTNVDYAYDDCIDGSQFGIADRPNTNFETNGDYFGNLFP